MKPLRQITCYLLTVGIVLSQKDSDDGRPYEFGFTIDGQQHRHEKKDQNGIVQGEFGFITADGVYHVTVYATDENGNFKILSMRNIRISAPLDGSPATGPISQEAGKYRNKEKQTGLKTTRPQPTPQSQSTQQQQLPQQRSELLQQYSQGAQDRSQVPNIVTRKSEPYIFTTLSTIKPACGGCGYVTTETVVPKHQNSAFQMPVNRYNQHSPPTETQITQKVNQEYIHSPDNGPNKYQPEMEMLSPNIEQTVYPVNNNVQNAEQKKSQQQNFQSKDNYAYQQKIHGSENVTSENERLVLPQGETNLFHSRMNTQNKEKYSNTQNQQKIDTFSSVLNEHNGPVNSFNPQQLKQHIYQRENVSDIQGIKSTGKNSPSGGSIIGPNPLLTSKEEIAQIPPVSVSNNIIHVGGNKPIDIPIKDKYSGMVNGLPDGIEEKDIKDILYKFHYTVGFHGHYEKGLSNGAKIGGYFVNGRDGISRVVTYVADENGYRPKFKFINLGLDSPDTPKEENEKSFGIKNFEFIWYPIQ